MKEVKSVSVINGRAKIGDKVICTNAHYNNPFYGKITGIINNGGGKFMVVVRDKNNNRHDVEPWRLHKSNSN